MSEITAALRDTINKIVRDHPLPVLEQKIRLNRIFFWTEKIIVIPERWHWDSLTTGRNNDGCLEIEMYLSWKKVDGTQISDRFQPISRVPEMSSIKPHIITVTTQIKMFPLSPQQAIFLKLNPVASYMHPRTRRTEVWNVTCWGIKEDVEKLEKEFPLSRR